MDTSSVGTAPVTPAADAPVQAPASSAPSTPAPAAAATPSEPYLKVNDRTVYMTREDAVKGYNELQSKYTPLSAWEKFYAPTDQGGLGFTNLKDPATVASLLDELIELRGKAQASSGTVSPATQGGNQPAGADQLTPEWQQYIKTLQDKAGFVTRDQLQTLEARLNERDASETEARFTAARDRGTDYLAAEMKAAGFPEDKELLAEIGASIGSKWDGASFDAKGIMIPDSPVDKFMKANPEEQKALIKEAFGKYLKFAETYATAKNANYGAQKTSAIASTPRPLTQSGAPAPATPDSLRSGGKWDHSKISQRVKQTMESVRAGLANG